MKKVKEFLKKLLERFKRLFKGSEKIEATPVATTPVQTPVDVPSGSQTHVSMPSTVPSGGVTDRWLQSGAGYGKQDTPTPVQTGPSVFDDGIIRYNHHTYVHGPSFSVRTEELKGPVMVSFTYTSQEAGIKAPTQISASATDGSTILNNQVGVEAQLPLKATSGAISIQGTIDTPGRVIAQLFPR